MDGTHGTLGTLARAQLETRKSSWLYSSPEVETLGARAKVLFVSDDGVGFRIFVDGHELEITRGVKITAGGGNFPGENEVEVTPTLIPLCGLGIKRVDSQEKTEG